MHLFHKWSRWKTVEATYTLTGKVYVQIRECSKCGKREHRRL